MKDKTIDIGILEKDILIFGGVYSNFQSLKKLHIISQEKNIDPSHIICTGDITAYCAQPEECIQFIMDWGIRVIAGNVEININEGLDNCGCNFVEGGRCDLFSKDWYPYILDNISESSKSYLKNLPHFIKFNFSNKSFFVLHGGLENPAEYIFKSGKDDLKESILSKTQSDFIIAGHCGIPFHQKLSNGFWYNAGVIGLPANDGKPHVWHLSIKSKNDQIILNHKSFNYDHRLSAKLIIEKNLPESYAKTINNGIWDNCEILPPSETALQGQEITLT